MKRSGAAIAMAVTGAVGLFVPAATGAQKAKPVPYFASIAAGKARMRTGPGRTYPSTWLYVRADLPVKVIAIYKQWRKIEDPDGTQGWMLANLLGTSRTALVRGAVVDLRERPSAGARIVWRAEPGVVGRLSQCGGGWCRLDVRGQAGFVETARLWGVDAVETFP